MSMKINLDLDEFEKWLTPKRLKEVLESFGYEVELKDEYKEEE